MVQRTLAPIVRRASGGLDLGPAEFYRVPVHLAPTRRVDLLADMSGAFDVGEGQPVGHAVGMAHRALTFATRLGLDTAARRRVAVSGSCTTPVPRCVTCRRG